MLTIDVTSGETKRWIQPSSTRPTVNANKPTAAEPLTRDLTAVNYGGKPESIHHHQLI